MGGRKRMSKSITTRLTREPGSIPGQGSTLNGGWGQHAQATTTQTTTATGLGTCLAKLQWFDWLQDEPNDYQSQNCLAFVPNYNNFGSYNIHWNDLACDDIARFICMKKSHWE